MRTLLIATFTALALAGCSAPPPRPFDVVVRALNDEDEPLRNAPVKVNGKEVGATDASGVLLLRRPEAEGSSLTISVAAPAGYKPAEPPRPLVLRRITRKIGGVVRELPVEQVFRFSALRRQYAVLVDVGEPDLPIEVFGARKAVTNSRGVASFLYEGAPGEELAVRVSCDSNPKLQPQVIAGNFVLASRSEAYLVQGRFSPLAKKAPPPAPKVRAVHFSKPKRLL